MPKTTAWERHCRRRDVIRLRYGKGFTAREISEELGWSQATIERDLDRIREETAVLGAPETVREHVLAMLRTVYEQEWRDLRNARRNGEFEEMHRAKASARRTVEALAEFAGNIEEEAPPSTEAVFDKLPAGAQEEVMTVAEDEVKGFLED